MQLHNDTKDDIYTRWKQDSATWTPKKLATHFGVSVLRVEAILRLKTLEDQWKQVSYPSIIARFLNVIQVYSREYVSTD